MDRGNRPQISHRWHSSWDPDAIYVISSRHKVCQHMRVDIEGMQNTAEPGKKACQVIMAERNARGRLGADEGCTLKRYVLEEHEYMN
jgi:hypothetical protein